MASISLSSLSKSGLIQTLPFQAPGFRLRGFGFFVRNELGQGLSGLRYDDLFAFRNAFQETREVRLGLVNVCYFHD